MSDPRPILRFRHRHLLGIEGLSAQDILILLDMAEDAVAVSRQIEKKRATRVPSCVFATATCSASRGFPRRMS
jgi:hypothetical protein